MRALFVVPMILLAVTSLAQAPAPAKAPAAPPAAAKAPAPATPAQQAPTPPGKPLTVNVTPAKKPAPKPSQWGKANPVNGQLLVHSGDTVQTSSGMLKLYGVFAPSFQRRCEYNAAMRSRNGLIALVSHKRVSVQRREGNPSRIKLLAGNQDVGNLLVAHGLAVHGKHRPRFC